MFLLIAAIAYISIAVLYTLILIAFKGETYRVRDILEMAPLWPAIFVMLVVGIVMGVVLKVGDLLCRGISIAKSKLSGEA